MCGIAGIVGKRVSEIPNMQYICNDMRHSMKHRGPDEHGVYIGSDVALVHARLSVVDIENGKQPYIYRCVSGKPSKSVELMEDKGFNGLLEEYAMVYNGELYNTEEIRRELIKKGHVFKSYSDTEVLLHAYAEYKDKCVEYLNGIYAFAVWEKHNKRMYIARDRIGVKPLFYTVKEGHFIYASEIKTLFKYPGIRPIIDRIGLAEVMFIGPGRTPGCGVYKDVYELCPGECAYIYIEDMGVKICKHTYWKLIDKEHKDSFKETVDKVRSLVTDAVNRQLVSDVPVCTFLSGGLDSSIISSIAARKYRSEGRQLNTVSVDYVDNDVYFKASKFQPNADASYIKLMSRYLKCINYYVKLDTSELVDGLYAAVEARDLPGMVDVDSSLLLFCKEIRKIATVGLSGECADEIFGGYPWYRDKEIRERYGFPWAQSTVYRASFINDDIVKMISPEEYVDVRYRQTLADTSVLPGRDKEETRMKQMINLNFKWFMQTLLDRKDRMSMHNSLEVRVPFCDYRIAEYMYSVPWEYKDYKGVEKGLLREAMVGLLPKEVLWRKKSPYPKTHNPAYRRAVSEKLYKIIETPSAPIHSIIKKAELYKLLETDRETPWYGQLMTTPQTIAYFIQLNYWLDKYKVEIVL